MIYLDNHATTPCDPRVLEAMIPYFLEKFANPASEIHRMGREARKAVDKAREQVANLIGAEPNEILFTSSATEANNLVILGLAKAYKGNPRNKLACSTIEHKSILAPCQYLKNENFELMLLPVDRLGHVKNETIKKEINNQTLFVSIQAANNEIGTIQDVASFCELTHKCGAFFHCDAAQAAGKIPVNVNNWNVDFMSLSAHKMYGPKGIAALYIKGGISDSSVKPLIYGGEQEFGLRPGTLNVPLIVGFGEACDIALKNMDVESKRLSDLRDSFESNLFSNIKDLRRNGDISNRLPNNSSLTFQGIDAEALIMSMPDIALSTGSACNSGAQEPSYVLKAIGLSHEDANSTLRIGIGRFNTQDEILAASKIFIKTVHNLKP